MTQVVSLFFTTLGNLVTVLGTVTILGIPFIYFVIGFSIMAMAFKYILK